MKKESNFVKTESIISSFKTSDSWVILSPIEQSIKDKIESVGTPLQDWNINIYRGVLTGYNEAFIINTEKREEILSNCKSKDEKERTEQLIRPILRGRDIKRYSYEWANLWLIATFPSRHYNIEDYQAVKEHLLTFGKERLEQTGKTYTLKNGEIVKARKKTNNKWFEVQDSISYWEDFFKPVIAWQRITQQNQFCLSKEGTVILDSMAFLSNIESYKEILLSVLNSKLIYFWMKTNVHEYGDTGFRLSNQYVEQIAIPQKIDVSIQEKLSMLVNKLISSQNKDLENKINQLVYKIYKLTDAEIAFIEEKSL